MEGKFPDTLLGFGYEFQDGKLKSVKTGEGFQFQVKEGDHSYNQRHYEALGEVVTSEVYKLLETECQLKRAPVPHDCVSEDEGTFIFLSEDALTNPDKLMVFIHGSGVVRAGQWSRRLIINESIDAGTQIPFIKEAQKEGYGILVTNTNDNTRPGNRKIKKSEFPEVHASHVWKHYIRKAKAKHVAIIAHSYGGVVVLSLFSDFKKEFMKRVFAVALTDSVHYKADFRPYKELMKVARNWVSSQDPLDTPVKILRELDIPRVSAGVTSHEWTSWSSFSAIWKFMKERLAAVKGADTGEAEGKGERGKEQRSEGCAKKQKGEAATENGRERDKKETEDAVMDVDAGEEEGKGEREKEQRSEGCAKKQKGEAATENGRERDKKETEEAVMDVDAGEAEGKGEGKEQRSDSCAKKQKGEAATENGRERDKKETEEAVMDVDAGEEEGGVGGGRDQEKPRIKETEL